MLRVLSLPAQLVRQIESTRRVLSPSLMRSRTDALRNKWEMEMIYPSCETVRVLCNIFWHLSQRNLSCWKIASYHLVFVKDACCFWSSYLLISSACMYLWIFTQQGVLLLFSPLLTFFWTSDLQTPSVGCWSWFWCWCWQEPRCPRHGLRSPVWAQLPTSRLLQVGPPSRWLLDFFFFFQSLKLSHMFHPVVTVSLCVLEYKVKMIKGSRCHKLSYQSIHISDNMGC